MFGLQHALSLDVGRIERVRERTRDLDVLISHACSRRRNTPGKCDLGRSRSQR
jgi:hypothetical protein